MREREGKQIRGQTGHIGRGGCKRDHARECPRKRLILFPPSVEREGQHSNTKKLKTDSKRDEKTVKKDHQR